MANQNEYLIPIGADLSPFVESIKEARHVLNEIKKEGKQTSDMLSSSFNSVSNAQNKVIQTGMEQNKIAKQQAQENQKLASILDILNQSASRLAGKESLKKFSKELQQLQALINKGMELDITIDDAVLKSFDVLIAKAKDDMEALKITVGALREELQHLDPSSEAFQVLSQQIELADKVIKDFGDGIGSAFDNVEFAVTNAADAVASQGDKIANSGKQFSDQLKQALQGLQDELNKTTVEFDPLSEALQKAENIIASGIPEGAYESHREELKLLVDYANEAAAELDNIISKEQQKNLMYGKALEDSAMAEKARREELERTSVTIQKLSDSLKAKKELLVNEYDIENVVRLNKEIEELENQIESLTNAGRAGFDDLGNKVKETNDKFAELKSRLQQSQITPFDKLKTQLSEINQRMYDTAARIQMLKRTGGVDTEGYKKLSQSLEQDRFAAKKLVEQMEAVQASVKGSVPDVAVNKSKTLRSELIALKNTMALMETQGKANTQEFENLAIEAVRLEEKINITQARIRALASVTKHIDATIQGVTALASGFGVAQGMVGLFGSENENLAKALQKVNSVMVILQGLQAIQNILQKQNILALLTSRSARIADTAATVSHTGAVAADAAATTTATVATRGFTAALATNPIGIILVALGALIAATSAYASSADKAADAQTSLNEAMDAAGDKIAEEQSKLQTLLAVAQNEAISKEQRALAIDKIRKDYPEYLSGLTTENALTKDIGDSIKKQIELIKQRAVAQAAEEVYKERLKEQIKAQNELNKTISRGIGFWEGLWAQIKSGSVIPGQLAAINDKIENITTSTQAADAAFNTLIATHQKLAEAQEGVFNPELYESNKKKVLELAQYKINVAKSGSKAEFNARKLYAEQEYQQAILDERLTNEEKLSLHGKYLKDLENLSNEARDRNYKNAIAALEAITFAEEAVGRKGSREYYNAKADVIKKAAKLEVMQAGDNVGLIKKIKAKEKLDLINLKIEQKSDELSIEKEKIDQQLNLTRKGTKEEIELRVKQAAVERDQQLNQLRLSKEQRQKIEEAYVKKVVEINAEGNLKILQNSISVKQSEINAKLATLQLQGIQDYNEEVVKLRKDLFEQQRALDIAAAETSFETGVINEKQKQAKIKEIIAKSNLEIILLDKQREETIRQQNLANIKSFNDLQANRAQRTLNDENASIAQRKKALEDYTFYALESLKVQRKYERKRYEEGKINITEYHSILNELTNAEEQLEDQVKKTGDAISKQAKFNNAGDFAKDFLKGMGLDNDTANEVVNSFGSLVSAYTGMIDELIAQKQRHIDELTSQIEKEQALLDKELSAQEKGYANNVAAEQTKIEALKAERQKEIDDMKALQKQKEAVKKAEIISDSIFQGQNLITSATNIFKAFSAIPFIGVPLAIAAIATMFGAFAAAKVQAFKMASESPQFDEGGGLELIGPDHAQGGLDVVERRTGKTKANVRGGEYMYVFKHTGAKAFEPVFDAINDYSSSKQINDLLKEIGGIHLMEDAPQTIIPVIQQHHQSKEDYRQALLDASLNVNPQLNELLQEFKEFKEAWKQEPRVIDFGDYVEITIGSYTKRVRKQK